MITLSCPICYQDFDEKVRVPLVLACGHTFCAECIQNSAKAQNSQSNLRCLTCKIVSKSDKNISGTRFPFPRNFMLLPSNLEDESLGKSSRTCTHNAAERKYVCFDPKCSQLQPFCILCFQKNHSRCDEGFTFKKKAWKAEST